MGESVRHGQAEPYEIIRSVGFIDGIEIKKQEPRGARGFEGWKNHVVYIEQAGFGRFVFGSRTSPD